MFAKRVITINLEFISVYTHCCYALLPVRCQDVLFLSNYQTRWPIIKIVLAIQMISGFKFVFKKFTETSMCAL